MAKRVLVSEAYKKARRKSKTRLLVLVGFGLCGIAIWTASFLNEPRMLVASVDVAIDKNANASQYPVRIKQAVVDKVRGEVEGLVADTRFGIIPGDHRLRMTAHEIKEVLEGADPRIASVEIVRQGSVIQSPRYDVVLRMHAPLGQWCGAKGWCISFDMRGYALGPQTTPDTTSEGSFGLDDAETVPLFYFSDDRDEPVPGDVLIKAEDLDIALHTYKEIERLNIEVERIVVEDTYFVFESRTGGKVVAILAPRTTDISSLLQRFSIKFREENRTFSDLEYVDFRFGTSVYFMTTADAKAGAIVTGKDVTVAGATSTSAVISNTSTSSATTTR